MTIQFKRGTTASTAAYIGAIGEVTVDTDKKTLVVHDSVTPGGSSMATPPSIQAQKYTAFPSAGVAPNFTLTPSPAITAYAANQRFRVAFNAAGTVGSNTLNISGLGVKNLKQYDATGAKVAGIVASGQLTDVEYDGTDLVIIDPLPSASGVLTGTIINYAGTAAPAGYLACPTAATNISRTTYAALFAAIGTIWGAGDGSTTFGMPWFPADYASVQANANVGSQTVGQVISHTHTYAGNSSNQNVTNTNIYGGGDLVTKTTDPTGGTANLSAGVRVLKCVKY